MPTFSTPGPLSLDLDLPAGSVEIDARALGETTVELEPADAASAPAVEAAAVELRDRRGGHELRVSVPQRRGFGPFGRDPQVTLRISCPAGAAVRLRTKAADLTARGALGDVELKSAAGDVRLEEAGRLEVKTASGDVQADVVASVDVRTASGEVRLGRADGPVEVSCVSGDVAVDDARGSVTVNTVSGDVELAAVLGGRVDVRAVSGDLLVGVRRGSAVWVDASSASGDLRSELELGEDRPRADDEPLVELRARTVSGDLRLVRATPLPHDAAQEAAS